MLASFRSPRGRSGALILAVLALATPALAAESAPPIVQRVCAGCHGVDGNYGWQQVPRIAGLPATYLAEQLKSYALAGKPPRAEVPTWLVPPAPPPAGARADRDGVTFMVGLAQSLSSGDIAAAAAWYATQKPAAGTPGEPALVAQGKALFDQGLPAKGVIACRDCHGAAGEGVGPFPRLAGQHAGYLSRQLHAFEAGERPHAGPMAGIAKGLAPDQIRALAAYAQSL